MARLCVVEALGGGPRALERRAGIIDALIAAVDHGRAGPRGEKGVKGERGAQRGAQREKDAKGEREKEAKGEKRAKQPPPLTAEGVVGAVLSVLHARLLASTATALGTAGGRGSAQPSRRPSPQLLAGLLGDLMGMIVLPYLGQAAAQRELSRAAPPFHPKKHPRGNPLEGLNMRLTYRTLRVLSEIASHPGASNRQVAAAAEIADQGQMSKLLVRLQALGLVENQGEGHAKGARNAWTLTPRGEQVAQSMNPT